LKQTGLDCDEDGFVRVKVRYAPYYFSFLWMPFLWMIVWYFFSNTFLRLSIACMFLCMARACVCGQATLESTNTKHVFASGDICCNTVYPRPKAGVFAVRAG
jgi:hypothetical protein